jgi:hypothetical protein
MGGNYEEDNLEDLAVGEEVLRPEQKLGNVLNEEVRSL